MRNAVLRLETGGEDALSVTDLLERANWTLQDAAGDLVVQGELAEWREYPSGHCYGTLRDGRSQISLAMYRRDVARLAERPPVGAQLLVFGSLTVYAGQGKLQFVARDVRLGDGRGLEALTRERLVESLREEGFLDPSRKRPLPRFPRAIGVVTSVGSAALGDITAGVRSRAPWVRVVVADANLVDPTSISRALGDLGNAGMVQVIVLARGGGSAADLAPYDSAAVAHAIVRCPVPVVSAVGHDLHVTVADLGADRRASTPSAACAIVLPDARELRVRLARLRESAGTSLARSMDAARSRSTAQRRRVAFALEARIGVARERTRSANPERLQAAMTALVRAARRRLENASPDRSAQLLSRVIEHGQRRLTGMRETAEANDLAAEKARALREAAARLGGLSPLRTLASGFAYVEQLAGAPVRSVHDIAEGDGIVLRLRDGVAEAIVTSRAPEVGDAQ